MAVGRAMEEAGVAAAKVVVARAADVRADMRAAVMRVEAQLVAVDWVVAGKASGTKVVVVRVQEVQAVEEMV